jgi:ABC-type multidrug transport system fused ATPase/permease subunit
MKTFIIIFFSTLIEEFGFITFFVNTAKSNIKIKQNKIILIILFAILMSLITFIFNKILKIIFSLFIIFMLYYFIIKKDIKVSLFYTLITYAIIFVFDILFSIILKIICNRFTFNSIENNLIILISSLLIFLIFIKLSKSKVVKKSLILMINTIEKNIQKITFLILISLLFILSEIIIYNVMISGISFYYCIFLFLIIMVILIIFQSSLIKLEKEKINNEYLLQINEIYGKTLENDKIYRHNVKNKFLTIKNLGDKNVNKLIDEYLNDEPISAVEINNLYNIPNSIKGIVCEKLYHFKLTKIIVKNNMTYDPFKDLNINEYRNLCEIIGISLDNATEATENLKNGYIYLNFFFKNEHCIIEIINNYCEKLDVDKIGNKKYSTKNRGSGFGLYSVLKVKEIKTKYIINNDNFIVKIELKKPKVR